MEKYAQVPLIEVDNLLFRRVKNLGIKTQKCYFYLTFEICFTVNLSVLNYN